MATLTYIRPTMQDLRFGLRMLVKDPWFTLLATIALALGIGVNNTVFTFVNAVLLRGLPFRDSQEIMLLQSRGYSIWKNRYGSDPAIVGRTIRINDVPSELIGVMPEGFRFPTGADMWQPFVPEGDAQRRETRDLTAFGRLAPGATMTQAQVEMSGIAKRLERQYPDTNKAIDVAVMTFNDRFNGGPIKVVFLALMGAVGFVLLIACVNVANLLLSLLVGAGLMVRSFFKLYSLNIGVETGHLLTMRTSAWRLAHSVDRCRG